jgi:hypothetical protein
MISMFTKVTRNMTMRRRNRRAGYENCHMDPRILRDIGLEPQMVLVRSFAGLPERNGTNR